MGYINPLPWHNKRKADQVIFARLDRALTNHQCMDLYPFATLSNFLIIGDYS